MARFFFHLRCGKELLADEHGDDLPDAECAYLHAFTAARELWTTILARREDPAKYSFEVTGSKGELLFTVPLAEVLDTARKGGKRRVGLADLKAILDRNRTLRQALEEQIERTRNSINRTHDLLQTLRSRTY